MTKLDALKELAAKVETGAQLPYEVFAGFDTPCQDFALQQRADNAKNAHDGSLDAAKALHEAVLPGWEWGVTCNAEQPGGPAAFVADLGDYQNGFEATNENPARAWLLAILRALISQEESA